MDLQRLSRERNVDFPIYHMENRVPKVVRIRKRYLDPHERKRASRRSEAA